MGITLNNVLIVFLSLIIFIFDKNAIIYLPITFSCIFIANIFNYQIFKLGISRFTFLGLISLIFFIILLFNKHNYKINYFDINLFEINTINFSYVINNIYNNIIIFLNNLNINIIIFGIILFPIFWIIKNEIFITNNRKMVFLESIRIEKKDLLKNNKIIDYLFIILFISVSLYTDFLIFGIIICSTILSLLVRNLIRNYSYIINILMISLLLLFLLINYNKNISIFDSINYYKQIHSNYMFKTFFLYPKTHINYNNGIIIVLLLYALIYLIIEYIFVRNINDININRKLNINEGVYFADVENKPLIIGLDELNQHVYVNATTGGGKTTLFLRMIKDITNKFKMPVIYIDGKGSEDLIHRLREIAKANNKVFKYFNFRDKIDCSGYDFLAVGTTDELKNKLLNLVGKQESIFYYERLSAFITIFLNIVDKAIKADVITAKLDIFLLYKLLSNKNKLMELVDIIGTEKEKIYFDEISEFKENPAERLYNIFTAIVYSKYASYLDINKNDNIINIVNSIKNNEIILFLLDSSSYPKDTEQWGKIIIDDINASFSSLEKKYSTLVIFDEFASYATTSITTSISIHRSKGLHAIIGSQSLETINNMENGGIIVSTIIANCNTKVLLRTNNQFDLELFNNNAGTIKDYVMTHQMDTVTGGSSTGMGSMRIGNRYKVDFEDLRGLVAGIGYIYRVKTNNVERINVKL